jgi:hypothetical protein
MQVLGTQVKNTLLLVAMLTRMSDHRRLVWSGQGVVQWLRFSTAGDAEEQWVVDSKIGNYGTKYTIAMSCMHRITFTTDLRLVPEVAEVVGVIDANLDGDTTPFPPRMLNSLQRQIGDADFYKLLFAALTSRIRPEADVEYYTAFSTMQVGLNEPLREAWRIVQPTFLGVLRQIVVRAEIPQMLCEVMEQFPGDEASSFNITLTAEDTAIIGTLRISVPDPLEWYNIAITDVSQEQLEYTYDEPKESF